MQKFAGELRTDFKKSLDEQRGDFKKSLDEQRGEFKKSVDELRGEFKKTNNELRGELKQSADELRGELKQSADELRGELKQSVDELRGDLKQSVDELRGELKQSADELRGELKQSVDELRGDLKQSVDELRGEFKESNNELRGELSSFKGVITEHTIRGYAAKQYGERYAQRHHALTILDAISAAFPEISDSNTDPELFGVKVRSITTPIIENKMPMKFIDALSSEWCSNLPALMAGQPDEQDVKVLQVFQERPLIEHGRVNIQNYRRWLGAAQKLRQSSVRANFSTLALKLEIMMPLFEKDTYSLCLKIDLILALRIIKVLSRARMGLDLPWLFLALCSKMRCAPTAQCCPVRCWTLVQFPRFNSQQRTLVSRHCSICPRRSKAICVGALWFKVATATSKSAKLNRHRAVLQKPGTSWRFV